MSTYRERRAARAERLREWSDKRAAKSAAAFDRAHAIAEWIPFGQPILVGHHSERRARRDQDRIHAGMRAGIDNARTAEEMASRAAEIDRQADRAIYSDDPDALERLAEKLADLEAERARLVGINAAIRKAVRGTASHAERAPILAELARAGVMTAADLADLLMVARHTPAWADRKPVTFTYTLTNLGGQITRTRERIALLSRPRVARALRVIAARRPGRCEACGQTFAEGASISPLGESCGLTGWGHTACAQDGTAAES